MNYVMEVGPLQGGIWALFTVDWQRQVHLAASEDREFARRDIVNHLDGKPARCCMSLKDFAREPGWTVTPPTALAKQVAAVIAVGVEVSAAFGGMMPPNPLIEAWIRAAKMFLSVRPGVQLADVDLDAHIDGATWSARRVISVLHTPQQTALMITPNRETHAARAANGFPPDCLLVSLAHDASATSEAVRNVYGVPFSVRVHRYRDGADAYADQVDLDVIIGSLVAITSLCSSGRSVGRGTADGVETIVMPLADAKPQLAS